MNVDIKSCAGKPAPRMMLLLAVLLAANTNASGGIQVNSHSVVRIEQIALISSIPAIQVGNPTLPQREKTKQQNLPGPAIKPAGEISGVPSSEQYTKPFGELHLLLSMKLSIPSGELDSPNGSTRIDDPQQQGSYLNEQKLGLLNAQIAALERIIKEQESQLGISTSPSVLRITPSGALARNLQVASEQSKPNMGASMLHQKERDEIHRVALIMSGWTKPAIGAVLILFAVSVLVWYRRYQAARQWQRGSIQVVDGVTEPVSKPQYDFAESRLPADASMTATAESDGESHPILPPDYELLEEADIYLRFGHDKLAEEVLRNAIKINPNNSQTYLRLLRIFFVREDVIGFLAVAKQLKLLGDGVAWSRTQEMGCSLDPSNTFYR